MATYIEIVAGGSNVISLPAASRLGRKDVVPSGFTVKPGSPLQIPKEYLFGNDSLIDTIISEQNAGRIFAREDNRQLTAADLLVYKAGGLVVAYKFLRNMVQNGLVFAVGTTGSTAADYNTDYTAGRAIVGATPGDFVAGTDWDYQGNGIDLAGAAATFLADGNSVEVAFVLYVDTSGPTVTLIAVFGNEVTTGDETIPTDEEIRAALQAGGSNFGGDWIRIAEVNVARAGAVITETFRGGEGALAAYFNRAPSA
jgi:hypothetical protein